MRERISVADFERACRAVSPDVRPSGLDEIQVIGLVEAGHAIRQHELGREPPRGERFHAGRLAPSGEIDARAAVECVETVMGAGADVAERVAE
jgi:hypothetical protein